MDEKDKKIALQAAQLAEKTAKIDQQSARIADLESQVADLAEKLSLSLARQSKKPVKKDSSNSSLPPSQDKGRKGRKTSSLREKSDRPSGGQVGHKGKTLEMSADPDRSVNLKPEYCSCCGEQFPEQSLSYHTSRQVVDIPLPLPEVTEYRQYTGYCRCGHRQSGQFPAGVNAPMQYGHHIEALVGYLSVYQYLPYKRLCELLRDVFRVPASQGTVENLLNRLKSKGLPYYEKIRQAIERETASVGGDETSCKVNGDNHWAWGWQTPDLCYLTISPNRGKATIEEHFPEGFRATLSSDRWAAHLNTVAKAHQICLAHLLRELNYLEAAEKHGFSIRLQELLREAIRHKKERPCSERGDPDAQSLEDRLDTLLAEHVPKESCPETARLQRSLIKLRQAVFPFLYDRAVPADNNASERAVRNMKVKMKVSGQFKSGQHAFSVIRSILDSVKKKQEEIFEVLVNMAKTQPSYA